MIANDMVLLLSRPCFIINGFDAIGWLAGDIHYVLCDVLVGWRLGVCVSSIRLRGGGPTEG